MSRSIQVICGIIILAGLTSAQSLSDDLAKARSIKLLEATTEDVVRILGKAPSFIYAEEAFQLSSSRIRVSYSSAKCTDHEAFGVSSDDWNVGEGKAVIVEAFPRARVTVGQLSLGNVSLKRDRLYRGRDDYYIYYNKSAGVAVITYGDKVDSIMLFPSRQSNGSLCRDKTIQKYHAKAEWKRDPRPKYACILRNEYANVEALQLAPSSDRVFHIETIARDPENDVLTYDYKVTAGKIIGTGYKVVWDLSDALPGSYSITAGVDDGAGILGNTVTKTVTVK